MNRAVLVKRPVAFRIPRMDAATAGTTMSNSCWRYFSNEEEAYKEADALGVDYQALYIRDGSVITVDQQEAVAQAIDGMGWPEIHAFQDELRRGQDYREDAGGFMMRAIRRLFGLSSPHSEITTYQEAAWAMVAKATAHSNGERERPLPDSVSRGD